MKAMQSSGVPMTPPPVLFIWSARSSGRPSGTNGSAATSRKYSA